MIDTALRAQARELILKTVYTTGTGHLGGSLSIIDFLMVLYTTWFEDFSIILSKGHGSLALYTTLDLLENSNSKILDNYGNSNVGNYHGHVSKKAHTSIALSSGSLGHGLPFALGLSVAKSVQDNSEWTVCVIGDGEMQEGTTWESLMIMQKFKDVSKLLIVIDNNNSQQSFASKQVEFFLQSCKSSSINVLSMDGHDIGKVKEALLETAASKNIVVFHLNTIKAYGIPSCHNQEKWHAGKPTSKEQLQSLINEATSFFLDSSI
jgi:transketolase